MGAGRGTKGGVVFRHQFLVGCLLLVIALAWPTISIISTLHKFSAVYVEAAHSGHSLAPQKQSTVIHAVEAGISSLIGGLVLGLLGLTLALDRSHHLSDDEEVAIESSHVSDSSGTRSS